MEKLQDFINELNDKLVNGTISESEYLENIVNELKNRSTEGTLSEDDIKIHIKCPICKQDYKGLFSFYKHISMTKDKDHNIFMNNNSEILNKLFGIYNEYIDKNKESKLGLRIPFIPRRNMGEIEKSGEIKSNEIIGGKGMEEKKNIVIPNVYEKLEELLTAVLGPQNANKINGIIYLFKDQEDYEDLDALKHILKQFRIPQGMIDTIIDDYSAYIGVEKESEDEDGDKKELEKGNQIKEIKTLLDQRLEDLKTKIKNDIELRELAEKAKSYNIDLSKYGLPDMDEKKDETVPWENPYTHEIIEVPKSKLPQYLAITQRYEETHKEKAEQHEDTVPWENPYTHEIIEVPKSKLPQ
ncbi:MAG: hypothetical protein QXR39_08545, partial [Candidatus Methanomethylicia archaeon]